MSQMRRAIEYIRRWKPQILVRARGVTRLGLTLLVLVSSACSQGARAFDSTTRTILLKEVSVPVECRRGEQIEECMLLLKQDWEAVVISYKSMCLRLGGAPAACQTEESK